MLNYFPEIATTICVLIYFLMYVVGIKKGRVKPVLATWVFFSFTTILSVLTDFKESGVHGLLSNTFNIADTLAVVTIFIIVLFQKDVRRKFNQFEKGCLVAVIAICALWLLTGANVFAHLSIQAMLVVAYLPTLMHLWKATKNTESLGKWFFDFLASVFGTIRPLENMALLPLVYCLRSIVSTLAVIFLILRLKYKEKYIH